VVPAMGTDKDILHDLCLSSKTIEQCLNVLSLLECTDSIGVILSLSHAYVFKTICPVTNAEWSFSEINLVVYSCLSYADGIKIPIRSTHVCFSLGSSNELCPAFRKRDMGLHVIKCEYHTSMFAGCSEIPQFSAPVHL